MGVSGAIVGAGVLGAGANIWGANTAANAQENASNNANATQMSMFNQEMANEQPYIAAGKDALSQIQSNMGAWNTPFGMAQFQEDPAYQFDLQQGEKAITNSSAATGGLVSSGELGGLSNYAGQMFSNEYSNAYNRYVNNISSAYSKLSGVASMGQAAASGANSAAQNAGNNISANQIGAGNAAGAASIGTANALSGVAGSVPNAFLTNSLINSLDGKAKNQNQIQTTPSGYGNTAENWDESIPSQNMASVGNSNLYAAFT